MGNDPDSVTQMTQLVAELERTEWRASVTPNATADIAACASNAHPPRREREHRR